MEGKPYKKTYLGFVVWLVVYIGGITLIGFTHFAGLDEQLMTRIIICLTNIACTILMYMVYKNEAVYWFTGISYDQAVNAGSARRRLYALKHFRLFGLYTIIYSLITVILQITGVTILVDTIVYTASLLLVCIRTMFYKL